MTRWNKLKNKFGLRRKERYQTEMFDSGLRSLGFLGIGAGIMYLLDPDRGRRRRALARDQMAHSVNVLGDVSKRTSRDFSHRVHGLIAESGRIIKNQEVTDETLEARVRSKLGRLVSRPHAIAVAVDRGRVAISGPVHAEEVKGLLRGVSKIPGVRMVKDALMVNVQCDETQGMQTSAAGRKNRANWAPAKRFMAATLGGGLMAYCIKRQSTLATGLGTLGFGLFTRALTNKETKKLIGVGAGDNAVMAHKTININAPVERVYEFFTRCQNFPKFMANVREVRQTGTGRSLWKVNGPMGLPIKWTAQITEAIPNQRIAWESMPGSLVKNSGTIQFRSNQNGSTQVEITLMYNPIAGAMGHALARFFGVDPKSEMDADLLRMKTLIETGHAPHDAAMPSPRAYNFDREVGYSDAGGALM